MATLRIFSYKKTTFINQMFMESIENIFNRFFDSNFILGLDKGCLIRLNGKFLVIRGSKVTCSAPDLESLYKSSSYVREQLFPYTRVNEYTVHVKNTRNEYLKSYFSFKREEEEFHIYIIKCIKLLKAEKREILKDFGLIHDGIFTTTPDGRKIESKDLYNLARNEEFIQFLTDTSNY